MSAVTEIETAGEEIATVPAKESDKGDILQRSRSIDFHDDLAEGWDSKYEGKFERRARLFRDEILPLIDRHGTWLDAGCGSGYFSRMLAAVGVSVVGIDASPQMLRFAKQRAEMDGVSDKLRFELVDDLLPLEFGNGSISGCVCLSVIEYLPAPLRFLDEVARVLEPGGMVIISIPHTFSPVRVAQNALYSVLPSFARRFRYTALSKFSTTRRMFCEILASRGIHIDRYLAFDPVLPRAIVGLLPPSLLYAVAVKRPKK